MRSLRRALLTTSTGALIAAMAAMPSFAQTAAPVQTLAPPAADPAAPANEAAPQAASVGDIVVTGSRITASGFTAPTPTTVIGAADIAKNAEPNIFNTIAQLPSLMGSTGRTTGVATTSSGTQGLSSFSLRGLGAIRTLTLLDGQRFIGANVTGVPDISQFPQLLISRVDVVTGGASASYGSDAVGGVVNFITEKHFEGVKMNAEGGATTYGDDVNYTAQIAWGHAFMDNRLHVEVSGEYGHEGGVPNPGFGLTGANGRHWYASPALQVKAIAATPAGQPQYTYITNAQQFQYAKYGLITAGPLQGIAFGANGQPFNFVYGSNGVPSKTASGSVAGCITPFCSGGDLSGLVGAGTSLASRLSRAVGYGRVGFDIAPSSEIYATVNVAQVRSSNSPNPGAAKNANLTIQCSNPYVPASIQAACATNNITSFQFGTSLANFPDNINVHTQRRNYRGVLGTDGKFAALGTTWSYDAYYEHGENVTDIHVRNISLTPRFNAAIQAVAGPNGTITCASAVAVAAGCQPFDIIGNVAPSGAALNYVEPTTGPFQHTLQKQDAASASINGQPVSLWAGPVSVAFGYEFRREWYRVRGDPYGNGLDQYTQFDSAYPADPLLNTTAGNNWYAGNYHNGQGKYHVNEGFLELNIPLLDSESIGKANLNVAGRETKYSTNTKWIGSWKIGGTYETPISGLRLRAVTSRDVRAPNLSELFAAPIFANNVVNDPRVAAGRSVTVAQSTLGNPALKPEIARNTEAGIALSRPNWLPGFSASFDYYHIKVDGVVSTLSAQQQVDLCYIAGNQDLCKSIFLDSTQPNGNFVNVQAFNVASIKTKGFDIETSYVFPLRRVGLPGTFTVRGLATHVISFLTDSGVLGTIPTESAGVNLGNTPHWKYFVTQSWDTPKASLTVTERWFSDGVYSNEYIQCTSNCPVSTAQHPTIDNNRMPGAFYVDLGGSYKVYKNITAYFKIDNLLNKSPVPAPATNVSYGANPFLYDVLGRQYRVGLRYNF
ncbi:TonB-dependent receptor domain-containing protein [Sphingomonas nostoxanthinifaciens]|uniref:TonB-dependent receptor domain-containing protein n=1 Tax=Sphingomonas nostoxanthinifaciens TaxID=2872652 RepID=UPI001CC2161C|nr:TonB-dependent receptor [Sphingomonas nostoxanthinifaciens]UAK26667.1 TonB-dependent receptor [Sphingomonas nostoxanthinifaciens]